MISIKYSQLNLIGIATTFFMANTKAIAFVGCVVAALECADFVDSVTKPKPKEPIRSEPIIPEPVQKGVRCAIAMMACP